MEPTAIGSKARWAPQARRNACMGWSWAAACGVQRPGHIVAVARLQLVYHDFYSLQHCTYEWIHMLHFRR